MGWNDQVVGLGKGSRGLAGEKEEGRRVGGRAAGIRLYYDFKDSCASHGDSSLSGDASSSPVEDTPPTSRC